jgi:hypothetical protein
MCETDAAVGVMGTLRPAYSNIALTPRPLVSLLVVQTMAWSPIVCLLPLFGALPVVVSDCGTLINQCLDEESCGGQVQANAVALSGCVDMIKTPPGSPPYCDSKCRDLMLRFLTIRFFLELLYCNCSTAYGIPLFGRLCEPFQSNALVKCNIQNASETPTG